MILSDKIIKERKKLGLSQEELAEQLFVSRQAVSKWESSQSVPDLQKIVMMSELFSVSTDYLLKDDIESESITNEVQDFGNTIRYVSIEEANDFIKTESEQSKVVALGVMLCILCPVLLIFLNGLAEADTIGITETVASVIGLIQLFAFITTAVFLFISYAGKSEQFDYLRKEQFQTANGVSELMKKKKDEYKGTYIRYLSSGIGLCILSPVPLIITALINESDVLLISMTALLLCIISVGVFLIVRVALIYTSYEVLLQEGEYNKTEKEKNKSVDDLCGIYWCFVVAIYLIWSFISGDWKSTWIVWPIASVLFIPLVSVVKHFVTSRQAS